MIVTVGFREFWNGNLKIVVTFSLFNRVCPEGKGHIGKYRKNKY